ncbi:hypothetical protein KAR34_12005, partial [bacterium]|nr:hypothetical protein [bacterium]
PLSSIPYAMRSEYANQVADNSITGSKIVDGAITNSDIADNAITSNKIVDRSIISSDIAAENITWNEIADGTIRSYEIGDGQVTTAKAPWAPTVMKGGVQISNPKILCGWDKSEVSGDADVIFSSAFSTAPVVLVSREWVNSDPQFVNTSTITSTGFHANTYMYSSGLGMQKVGPIGFNWLAIGY